VVRLDDPPPTLRPDLSATADIVTAIRDSALSIPIIALTIRQPDSLQQAPREPEGQTIPLGAAGPERKEIEGVFIVKDDVAKFRPVKVGIAGRDYFEILEGLEPGDTIVAGSYQAIRKLHDGAHVKVQKSRSASADRESIALESGRSSGGGGGDVAEAATLPADSTAAAEGTSVASEDESTADSRGSSTVGEHALPYSVLLVSFSSLDDAVARQREWSRPDLPVYVAPTPIRGRVFYRVLAGATAARPEAEALMKRLATEGIKSDVRDWDVRPARYAFRLGTYEDAAAADARVDGLRSQGVPAYVVPAIRSGGAGYYVYAGGYESVDDAQPMRDLLTRAGLEAELVERTGDLP
jgi:cell division septation protein DedD